MSLGKSLDMPSSQRNPSTKRRQPKVPTLNAEAWEPYKDQIVALHIGSNLSLPEVRRIMEQQHGFQAELRQYRLRVSQWGLDKNIKPHEMSAIVRKRQHRRVVETDKPDLSFTVRGNAVEPRKIDRWMKSRGISDDQIYADRDEVATPSVVDCKTWTQCSSPPPGGGQVSAQKDLNMQYTNITAGGMIDGRVTDCSQNTQWLARLMRYAKEIETDDEEHNVLACFRLAVEDMKKAMSDEVEALCSDLVSEGKRMEAYFVSRLLLMNAEELLLPTDMEELNRYVDLLCQTGDFNAAETVQLKLVSLCGQELNSGRSLPPARERHVQELLKLKEVHKEARHKNEHVRKLFSERSGVYSFGSPILNHREIILVLPSVSEIIARHMQSPFDVDYLSRSPLHAAAIWCTNEEVLPLLIKWGVPINHVDLMGRTALHLACKTGSAYMVDMLLTHPEILPDIGTTTPLMSAVCNGHTDIVKLLLSRNDVDPNKRDKRGQTPLYLAAENNHGAIARLLLTHSKVEINCKENSGRTPLWVAANGGHEEIVRLLLARPDVNPNVADLMGDAPLAVAAASGHEEVVRLFLAKDNVDSDIVDYTGWTPLRIAESHGHHEVARMLRWR